MASEGRMEYLDLLIKVLEEHEKKLDDVISRLECLIIGVAEKSA